MGRIQESHVLFFHVLYVAYIYFKIYLNDYFERNCNLIFLISKTFQIANWTLELCFCSIRKDCK